MTCHWLLALTLVISPAAAARGEEARREPAPADANAGRFARGSQEWGLSLGQASGLDIWGSRGADTDDVQFIGLVPRFGVGLTDPIGSDAWYHGNLELIVEGSLLAAYAPKGGFLGGVALAFRYNLLGWRSVVPFLEIGGGVAGLELDLDDQSDGLSFTAHGGLGLHGWLSERTALTASWRLHHLSNAGVGADNSGINDSMFLVGLSYFP